MLPGIRERFHNVRACLRVDRRHGSIGREARAQGGTAFYTRYPVTIENNNTIAGGGGGGGRTELSTPGGWVTLQGSGGAGNQPGLDGIGEASGLVPATETSGGMGPAPGGGPGQAGTSASGTGGAAGIAVDGDSYITWSVVGTILGSQVN